MALKKFFPDVRFNDNKVSPDEMNMRVNYVVANPSISDTGFGTVSSATAAAVVFTNVVADYPRNVLFTILGVAGGMGGTLVVNGKDQFGITQSETIAIGSAAGGGTAAGTKIFSSLSSGTVTPVGLGGTAVGTAKVGYALGTAAGIVALFGLPVRVAAVSDVKRLTWINNGTSTAINGGTLSSSYIGTANHTFQGSAIVAITDQYHVTVKSTYNDEYLTNVA